MSDQAHQEWLSSLACELYTRREALIARMSPAMRSRVFPKLFPLSYHNDKPQRAQVKRHLTLEKAPAHILTVTEKTYAARGNATTIVSCCARTWDVPENMIYGDANHRIYATPRYAVMALLRNLLGLSLRTIGQILGGRHHTTVMAGLARHTEIYEGRSDYTAKYDAALSELTTKGNTDNGEDK